MTFPQSVMVGMSGAILIGAAVPAITLMADAWERFKSAQFLRGLLNLDREFCEGLPRSGPASLSARAQHDNQTARTGDTPKSGPADRPAIAGQPSCKNPRAALQRPMPPRAGFVFALLRSGALRRLK